VATREDLSTGKHIHGRASGTSVTARSHWYGADLPALEKVDGKAEDLTWEVFRDTLVEQAEQGVDYFIDPRGRAAAVHSLTAKRMTGTFRAVDRSWRNGCLAHHVESFFSRIR